MKISENDRGNPLVSICIPTYNSGKYLKDMLLSVANQTYKNIEVLISDNSSTDNTNSILASFSQKFDWKVIKNPCNVGASNNMSGLLKLAMGKYVALYHADDLYALDIVEKSVIIMQNKETVGMVSAMGYSIDAAGTILSDFNLPDNFKNKNLLDFKTVFLEILSQRNFFIITPSVMVRGIYYMNNPYFNPRYKSAADYGKWFEILQDSDLYIIDEKLIKYRTHDKQGSQLEIKQNNNIPDSIPLYFDYAKKDKKKFWSGYQYSYYKLMVIQALKLNNQGNFNKSQYFLRLILRKGSKTCYPIILLFLFFNKCRIKVSLDKLMLFKKKLGNIEF